VAGNEPLAEVAQEVVVTRLRSFGNEPTARVGESLLHLQPWKSAEDAFEITRRKRLNAETTVVETDPHCAHRHFGFFVEGERRRRVERDQVPDQLDTAIR